MPRRPRLTLPDVPLHVTQRGNNRQEKQGLSPIFLPIKGVSMLYIILIN